MCGGSFRRSFNRSNCFHLPQHLPPLESNRYKAPAILNVQSPWLRQRHQSAAHSVRYCFRVSDEANEQNQMALCRRYGREFVPCPSDSKMGLALQTPGKAPINGLRHRPAAGTNGWYISAGDYSSEKDFFKPLHTSHLPQRLPQVVRFLGLPPGSRFLLAGDHVDVWFDESPVSGPQR